MRTLVSGFGDGQEPIATGRCPRAKRRASEQRVLPSSCSLADEGTVGRHDEVIRERGEGSKAPVIDMHAHPEITACLIVPDRPDLE
jgi:hypothetical protein